jgi:hypothetical protein
VWSFVHRLPRYASTFIYCCIMLLQLLYSWHHQSQKLWVFCSLMVLWVSHVCHVNESNWLLQKENQSWKNWNDSYNVFLFVVGLSCFLHFVLIEDYGEFCIPVCQSSMLFMFVYFWKEISHSAICMIWILVFWIFLSKITVLAITCFNDVFQCSDIFYSNATSSSVVIEVHFSWLSVIF